jgi:transposase InsO family protein
MELLKGHNWMPWKRRMLAVLRDLGLEKYIAKDAKAPEAADRDNPTQDEKEASKRWKEGDAKARTRIELSIGDSEMIHISGADSAREMWEQLTTVKESKGRLGVLATRRTLYRMTAEEGFDMVEHISKLRKLQEELHLMENKVTDEDFVMILITSLPESWDQYTSAYLGSSSNMPTLKSHELVAILLEEDRRRRGRNDDSASGVAMQAKFPKSDKGSDSKKTEKRKCFNCGKEGHIKEDCWSKGGGREGKGPARRKKGGDRAHQTQESINTSLNDVAYSSRESQEFSRYDWILDSATTSHICTTREAFTDYTPLRNSPIYGLGSQPINAQGRGTVILNFKVDGKLIRHVLREVLHAPDADNCLLSISRFDAGGGDIHFKTGVAILRNKSKQTVGIGKVINRLYLLDARAELPGQERANLATTQKLSWDQWHRRFGHLSMGALEKLNKEKLVKGLMIDESSIPSRSCEACIQAKQAHRPFPKEAENRTTIAGERIMGDVWGPARVESIGKWKYYLSLTDDAKRYVTTLFLKTKDQAGSRIKEHVNMIEKQYTRLPKYLRFDNGKELVNEGLKKWAAEKGIIIETTAPYSPSQNGVAERFNRTLLELARAMLFEKNLPVFLWDEAVAHAAYLRN